MFLLFFTTYYLTNSLEFKNYKKNMYYSFVLLLRNILRLNSSYKFSSLLLKMNALKHIIQPPKFINFPRWAPELHGRKNQPTPDKIPAYKPAANGFFERSSRKFAN